MANCSKHGYFVPDGRFTNILCPVCSHEAANCEPIILSRVELPCPTCAALREELKAGAHLVASVGDKNRELESRLAAAESQLCRAREACKKHVADGSREIVLAALSSAAPCLHEERNATLGKIVVRLCHKFHVSDINVEIERAALEAVKEVKGCAKNAE